MLKKSGDFGGIMVHFMVQMGGGTSIFPKNKYVFNLMSLRDHSQNGSEIALFLKI